MSFRKLSLKWFGSLSNLSFRRSTDKSESKSSSFKSGAGCGPADGPDGAAETTVDDMGAMRPRTASYVRSSESYTHMGTLPRLLRRRDKKSKGGPDGDKTGKDKNRVGRSQSLRPAGDGGRGPQRPAAASCRASEVDGKAEPKPTDVASIHCATSPSGGSSAALRPETSDKPDAQPEETPPPPLSRGGDKGQGKDELQSRREGAGKTKAHCISSHMEPEESQVQYVQVKQRNSLTSHRHHHHHHAAPPTP